MCCNWKAHASVDVPRLNTAFLSHHRGGQHSHSLLLSHVRERLFFSFPFAADSDFACHAYRLRSSATHDGLIAYCRLCCPSVETCNPREMS